jgi:hypothetical protein
MTLTDKFIKAIPDMEVVAFAGVAKVLRVPLYTKDEEPAPRDFVEVFGDVVAAFDKKDRKFKRELLSLIKKANKKKGDVDASDTTNSES